MKSRILIGDARHHLKRIRQDSIDCIVTSVPYFQQRKYGDNEKEIGWGHIENYMLDMRGIFYRCYKLLKEEGTCWINVRDTYTEGLPSRVPFRFIELLNDIGYWFRQDIIWHKPNPMPESVTKRCTQAHEYILMFTKSHQNTYYYKQMKEPATYAGQSRGKGKRRYAQNEGMDGVYDDRNKRTVWTIQPDNAPKKGTKHYATYPEELIEPIITSCVPAGGVVLDPFGGSGTTAVVAEKQGKSFVMVELYKEYADIAKKRLKEAHKKPNLLRSKNGTTNSTTT